MRLQAALHETKAATMLGIALISELQLCIMQHGMHARLLLACTSATKRRVDGKSSNGILRRMLVNVRRRKRLIPTSTLQRASALSNHSRHACDSASSMNCYKCP